MFKMVRASAPIHGVAVLAVTIVVATLMASGRSGVVLAHSDYDRSEPAQGATVSSAPTLVKVWFTEGLRSNGSSLQVQNASGQRVDTNDSKVDTGDPDRTLMTVGLRPSLPAGTYKVLWKSVAADDGEADEGELSFTVGATTSTAPAAGAPAPQPGSAPIQTPRELPRTGVAQTSRALWSFTIGGLLVVSGLLVGRARRTP